MIKLKDDWNEEIDLLPSQIVKLRRHFQGWVTINFEKIDYYHFLIHGVKIENLKNWGLIKNDC